MIDPTDLRDVFDRAASLPPQDRAAFLARACGDNDGLRREVERLLAADARLGSTFDTEPGSDPAAGSVAGAMSLQAGTRLGPYEIVAALGAGGMGEVYKARDTRLDRTVAIKVLSHDLISEPTARQRFDREARAIAALSHPNICALHDVGHQDGIDFLVMEFLDGETLAARLRQGKLPLTDALTHAIHIADALAAAHRAGIVHRDLKPANIMLTSSGVKLLDFGLAKRRQPLTVSDITKLTAEPLSHTGMILGTVQYMAPEQLEGRPADERTDIFAFGVVLYEMLTGRRAFDGASSAALIGNILHAEPAAPSSLERLSPKALDEVVHTCLAKDPNARIRSIIAVRARLADVRSLATLYPSRSGNLTRTGIIVSALIFVCIASLGLWWVRSPAASDSRDATSVQRNLTRLTFGSGIQRDPTFSPDGRFIAYASDKAGNFDIWVQPVAGGDPVQVTKSTANDSQPDWSPDGSRLVFRSERDGGGIFVIPALGGPETKMSSMGYRPQWAPDGSERILFATSNPGGGISVVPKFFVTRTDGSLPTELTLTFIGRLIECPAWSWGADARHLLVLGTLSTTPLAIYTVPLDGGEATDFADESGIAWSGLTLLTSRQIVVLEGSLNGVRNLWRARLDAERGQLRDITRLTTGVGADVGVAASRDGTRIAYTNRKDSTRVWIYKLDRSRVGVASGFPVTGTDQDVTAFSLHPDATQLAYSAVPAGSEQFEFRVQRIGDESSSELVARDFYQRGPFTWSRDGRWLAYARLRITNQAEGTFETALVRRPTLGGLEETLVTRRGAWVAPYDWSLDGQFIWTAGSHHISATLDECPVAASGRDACRTVITDKRYSFWRPRLSPNGKWIAFVGIPVVNSRQLEAGTDHLGVASVSDASMRLLSPRGQWSDLPAWSDDGRRLYFVSNRGAGIMNVWTFAFDPETGLTIGEPKQVTNFDGRGTAVALNLGNADMIVRDDRLALTMTEFSGSIWMLDNANR